jgi:hypothetical protein
LAQVGPIAETGFPEWYRDSTGLRLESCWQAGDDLCPPLVDELPDPEAPPKWPTNLPGEHFYQLAGAELTLDSDARAIVALNVEAACSCSGTTAAYPSTPGTTAAYRSIRSSAVYC